MEQLDLKDIERRPLRHWNIDGLPELYMGLLWLVWGGLWLYGQSLSAGPAHKTFWTVVPLLPIASTFLGKWFLLKLKQRITYPRAGYVQAGAHQQRAARAAVGLGALCTVGGTIRLRRFLRANPEPSETEE